MNTAIINRLADLIESAPPERFNLTGWYSRVVYDEKLDGGLDYIYYAGYELIDMSDCGTAACVAGWAVAMMHGSLTSNSNGKFYTLDSICHQRGNMPTLAADILGLSPYEADRLFYFGGDSIWHELAKDSDEWGITFLGNTSYEHRFCDPDGCNCCDERSIDERSVSNKTAAEVLRRIAKGEIVL